MKKKYWCSIVCAICIVGTAMTAYAASSASLALQTFQKSAESAAIGLSKKAYAEVWNSSKINRSLDCKNLRGVVRISVFMRTNDKLAKGANTTLVENQSRDSSFKLRFESGGGVAGVGKIILVCYSWGILMDPPK